MASERTLDVTVDGIGTFVFLKRNVRLQLKIEGEAERMTGGPVARGSLNDFAVAVATLEALTVTAPPGWTLNDVDPLDDDSFGDMLKVYRGLRAAEVTFRAGAKS